MSATDSELPPPNGRGVDLPEPAAATTDPIDEARWFNQRVAGVPAWGMLGAAVVIWVVVVAIAIRSGGDGGRSDLSFRVTSPTDPPSLATSTDPAPASTSAAPTTSTVAPDTTSATSAPAAVTGTTVERAAITLDATAATTTATTDASSAGTAASVPTTDQPVDAATEDAEATVVSTSPTTSVAPATTAPPTTTPATTTPTTPTTTPATTTPTTAPATTTTTTVAAPSQPDDPSVGISGPVTATGPNGETLTVTPRRGPCRYGPECFVASFRIDGFSYQPQEFVCEFSSGARYVFRFSSAGADPACSTLDVPDSIVVEVGALRTEPVTIGEQLPSSR